MEEQLKNYMVLDENGNPLSRMGDEVNPFVFHLIRHAFSFVDEEISNHDFLTVVEIKEIEKVCSGM